MKGDIKIKRSIKEIYKISAMFLEYPNQCAYTDRMVEGIIDECEKIKEVINNR